MVTRSSRLIFNLVLALCLLIPGASVAAHQTMETVDVRIWTFNMSDEPVYDICYTLVGYSNTGCDENLDGSVLFEDIPVGQYVVEPSYPNGSDYETGTFNITVTPTKSDFSVQVNTRSTESSDIRIWTSSAIGQPVEGICYQLADYSQVGCDDNGDGNVLFEDIPHGRYLVVASYPNGNNHRVAPFHIDVNAENADFTAVAEPRNQAGPVNQLIQDVTDVHLITRDPETGEILTDVCYELVDYSNIGCDENADGHVTFADIPYGQYTIRQVTTPEGYEPMDEYIVSIMGGPNGFDRSFPILLSQSKTQASANEYNASVVFYSQDPTIAVEHIENCAQLWNGNNPVSNVGCDEDVIDGSIDFMHTRFDPQNSNHTLDVELACQYQRVPHRSAQLLWIGQNSYILFVEVQASGANCT